jgi:hypothetical protein
MDIRDHAVPCLSGRLSLAVLALPVVIPITTTTTIAAMITDLAGRSATPINVSN